MENNKKIIGHNIRKARLAKGLTQKYVAFQLGLPFQNISAWERGEASPPLKHLTSLSEILGVSVDQLTKDRVPGPGSYSQTNDWNGSQEARFSELIREAVSRELISDPRLKLLEAYLEEIVHTLRAWSGRTKTSGAFQETVYETSELRLNIPPLPDNLSAGESKRWNNNVTVLERWARTRDAFWAPSWALERFCREAAGFYEGGRIEDIGGLLKEYIEEGIK